MEIARAVPEIVYALIFVFSFGLGPLPGVLAIAVHSTGALGKLFSEVNENIDHQPLEGIRAAGGNWFQVIRYGVVPQVLPNFLSYALLRFEINVRAASVVGFVGAGGIGQELMFVIRQFIYVDISAIVLLIMLMVTTMDITCEKIRHYTIGKEALQ
jgi:phosphonate transport system permease protein